MHFPHFDVAVALVDSFAHYAYGTWKRLADWSATQYLASACNVENLTHTSCLCGTQNMKKPARSLTGYLESLVIIFFNLRNSVFPPSGSSLLSVCHQLWEEGVGATWGARVNQEGKYKVTWVVLSESVGHGRVGGDGPYPLEAFSGPPHSDGTWQSGNPSLTYSLPNPPLAKQMEKCSDAGPHTMSQSWWGTSVVPSVCAAWLRPSIFACTWSILSSLRFLPLLSLLTFQFRLRSHEEIIQRRVARNAWHVCIQSRFRPDPSAWLVNRVGFFLSSPAFTLTFQPRLCVNIHPAEALLTTLFPNEKSVSRTNFCSD